MLHSLDRPVPPSRNVGSFLLRGMTFVITAGLAALSFGQPENAPAAEKHAPPNIVFILADDLGWGDLGCYGHPYLKTPNLDQLAAEGTRFLQFYVNSPVCSPSRTAFLTGHYPVWHGVHGHFATHERNVERDMPDWLYPGVTTICDLLQKEGYATGHFGKWHLTSGLNPGAPALSEYGIDESRALNANPNGWKNNMRRFVHHASELIVDEAVAFIKKHQDEPFYINVWAHVPHARLLPTPEELAVYKGLSVDPGDFQGYMPQYLRHAENLDAQMQVYCAEVTGLDQQLGRLFDVLEKTGLAENTIVVFTSDNGPEDYHVPNVRNAGVGSTGPFRGRKRSLYEGGVRTPLIVRWPDHVPAGRVDRTSVLTAVDFLPTFASLAGVKLPEDFHLVGENVSEILLGHPRPRRQPIFWEWRFGIAGNRLYKPPRFAIRQDVWKLFMSADGETVELYNIPNDPGETKNAAATHPTIVRRLQSRLRDWQDIIDVPASGS